MGKSETIKSYFILLAAFLFYSFSTVKARDDSDLELLLSFKSSAIDPLRFISTNWNSSTNFCNWYGVTCINSSRVTGIELFGKNISGDFSNSLLRLPFIENINLSNNQFTGEIPEDIFSCSSLRYLNLSNNNFTGPFPHGFIPRLETLDLSNNMLSGEIPVEIRLFSGLKVLDLGGNVFNGTIPNSISDLRNLQYLTLAGNQLVGEIPPELGRMRTLKWIYLGYNNLSGEIPNEIGDLSSLNHLDLVYNNLTGEIPSSLGNLSNLQYLFLYQNKLTGWIPLSIFNLENLNSLDLSDNNLSGEISELVIRLKNLEVLHLFSNNFTGKIPKALASLPHLKVLQLWSNNLSGDIPENLGKENNLTALDLSTNQLTGNIPQGLCTSGHLYKLILFSNSLDGEIPKNLSKCKSLARIRIQNNRFSGELPPDFTKLPLVYFIDASGNELSGRIDQQKWDMPSLQMIKLAKNKLSGNLPESFRSKKLESLDLSENRFSGSIPASFGGLTELVQLKLSQNQLSGFIPGELSLCKKLVKLDLSRNILIGQIPISFGEMPVLGDLDLSENRLWGEIPSNLGKVESLIQINISHNHFHGGLPLTGAFLAINASAVNGNDLCGGSILSGLPACKTGRKPVWWFFITSLLAVLAVLVLSVSVILFIRRRTDSQLKRIENEVDSVWELKLFDSKLSKSITIEDILASMREENVISREKNGTMYRGKSAIKETQFVVKELRENNRSLESNYWTEIVKLGKLRHPNIIKLIGICRSEKDEIMLYEYIDEGKKLNDVLNGLSWERRRKIVMGIAKALKFLHNRCSKSVWNGNLSPEDVIIDGKDEARLRLNVSRQFASDSKGFFSSGYVAPEIRESKEMTEKSDIYVFGILLIEILTGKGPTTDGSELGFIYYTDNDNGDDHHRSIVEWASYCYSDCHFETWIEPTIKEQMLNHQKQIVEMMNLALQCTALDPNARPSANQVLKTLESVQILSGSSCGSGVHGFLSSGFMKFMKN